LATSRGISSRDDHEGHNLDHEEDMDLNRHLAVVSRFRALVIGGFVVAVLLAFAATVRVQASPLSLSWRQQQTWASTQTMLVTLPGTPFGAIPTNPSDPNPLSLTNLPTFYAQLANSESVKALVLRGGPLGGAYLAYQVTNSVAGANVSLPFLAIDGYASTPAQAILIAQRVSTAFQGYLHTNQVESRTPPSARVLLEVTSPAEKATLVKGRGITAPAVVFLAVMLATLGLAYLLENLRPRPSVGTVAVAFGRDGLTEASRVEASPSVSESPSKAGGLRGHRG
jgi:hypothetical protein